VKRSGTLGKGMYSETAGTTGFFLVAVSFHPAHLEIQIGVVLLASCFNRRLYCVGILFFIEELSIFFERSKKTKQKKIAG